MTGSERPSPEPLLKKEASPAALGGIDFSGMPWIVGFGASQPYSRGEFQEKLRERFRVVLGVWPNELFQNYLRGYTQNLKISNQTIFIVWHCLADCFFPFESDEICLVELGQWLSD